MLFFSPPYLPPSLLVTFSQRNGLIRDVLKQGLVVDVVIRFDGSTVRCIGGPSKPRKTRRSRGGLCPLIYPQRMRHGDSFDFLIHNFGASRNPNLWVVAIG